MISECLYIFYSFIKSVKILKKRKEKKKEVYIDILISNSFSLQFMIRKKKLLTTFVFFFNSVIHDSGGVIFLNGCCFYFNFSETCYMDLSHTDRGCSPETCNKTRVLGKSNVYLSHEFL